MFFAPIVQGNSGGTVFNGNGEFIGIKTLGREDALAMNYAIPVSAVKAFIEQAKFKEEEVEVALVYKILNVYLDARRGNMSLIGKNKALYSYRNECRIGANFQYKDFEKTKSYSTNFSKSNFNYASLRAAQMKYCNFNEASFVETEFIGTNIKGSCFKGAIFKNAIFKSVVMDKTDFTGAELVNCIFYNTRFTNVKGLNISNSRIIHKCPELREYSQELLNTIQALRANDIIRRSKTLHLKNNTINTLYLQELLGDFPQDELVVLLKLLPCYVTTQFYTLSYLKKLLTKIKKETII